MLCGGQDFFMRKGNKLKFQKPYWNKVFGLVKAKTLV